MSAVLNPAPAGVLLTEDQAAHLLSLAPNTLRAWRMRGTGPAFIVVGDAVRYRRLALSAWLSTGAVSGPGGVR